MEWMQNIQDDWVRINILDIRRVYEGDFYIWDAQSFAGLLSFADFYLALKLKQVQPNPALDLQFLEEKEVLNHLIFSLKNMLGNLELHKDLDSQWPEWEPDVLKLLEALEVLDGD